MAAQKATEYKRTFKQANPRYYTNEVCPHIPVGLRYPSVTTITGNTAKPMLYAWYSTEGTDKLKAALNVIGEDAVEKLLTEYPIGSDYWKSGFELSARAQKIGTLTHEEVSRYLGATARSEKATLNAFVYEDNGVRVSNENALNAFRSFLHDHEIHPIQLESALASNDYGYGGRQDILGYLDSDLSIVDVKVAKAIYDEHAMQLSAYQYAVQEMTGGREVKKRYVLRLDNLTGQYELQAMPDMFAAFLGMRDYWYAVKQFDPKSKGKEKDAS